MSFTDTAKRLKDDFPDTPEEVLIGYVEEFIDIHLENLVQYHDYSQQFEDLIDAGLLPEDKYELLHDEDTSKYLELWDIDFIVEFIEDVKGDEYALQKRKQPKSRLASLWAYIKAAFRCRCP